MYNRSEVVNQLKLKCFSRLSFTDKKVLVENGRPCPDLDILTTVKIKKTVDNTSCTRHFCKELYNISD